MAAWDHLAGADEESLASYKLSRTEKPRWEPPVLTFLIERHGGTVLGSSRADLQQWTVDLDSRTAEAVHAGHRQLRAMNARLDVRRLVRDVARAVNAEEREDPRIRWHRAIACPVLSRIVPGGGAPKQTVHGRRRRVRDALAVELRELG